MKFFEKINEVGIENVRFLVPMRQIRNVFHVIFFTESNDPVVPVMCKISEERYKVCDDYKITMSPEIEGLGFGQEDYYLSDVESLVREGEIKIFQVVDIDRDFD